MSVILIVEDDAFIRQIGEVMIQDCGHQTLSAGSVCEALAILRSSQPLDALFTDIYLESAMHGGCDLAIQARSLRPGLPVIYTSGNTLTEKMKSLFLGDAWFLPKPYTQTQLKNSVEGLLAA